LIILLSLWIGSRVQAQCGDVPPKSSCTNCHAQEYPVYGKGEWHSIHAYKDCCIDCHGGNGNTMDKNLAHQGLVANPLSDIYTDCYHCHPADYATRANLFAGELGVTPGSCPTPTGVPIGLSFEHPIVIQPPSTPSASVSFPWFLALGGLACTALLFFVLGILYHHLRI
jgi:hypothetical protein